MRVPNVYGVPLKAITCVEDLRQLHRRRVPKMFYDYAESGSWTESTYRRNEEVLQSIKLRQRVAVDISSRSVRGSMLGEEWTMPVGLAPTGLAGMQCADGEILAARAAEAFGVPFTLSTMSICSIEDIAANTTSPFWFQLYVMKDREFVAGLIDRAKRAGCSALMLTLDLPVMGQRHKDVRNQMTAPPKLTVKNLLNIATKPRWALGMLGTQRRNFGNVIGHVKGIDDLTSLASWSAEQLEPSLDWDTVEWVKEEWGGKFILKGILDPLDAKLAIDAGADAVVVSNHGGRQLDGAPASIEALPQVVAVAGDAIEVWMDGGIRAGQDVLKAIAYGAKGTLIGKAFLNGLGAMGEPGVTRTLELIERELELTMAFCGHTSLESVDRSIIWEAGA